MRIAYRFAPVITLKNDWRTKRDVKASLKTRAERFQELRLDTHPPYSFNI